MHWPTGPAFGGGGKKKKRSEEKEGPARLGQKKERLVSGSGQLDSWGKKGRLREKNPPVPCFGLQTHRREKEEEKGGETGAVAMTVTPISLKRKRRYVFGHPTRGKKKTETKCCCRKKGGRTRSPSSLKAGLQKKKRGIEVLIVSRRGGKEGGTLARPSCRCQFGGPEKGGKGKPVHSLAGMREKGKSCRYHFDAAREKKERVIGEKKGTKNLTLCTQYHQRGGKKDGRPGHGTADHVGKKKGRIGWCRSFQ